MFTSHVVDRTHVCMMSLVVLHEPLKAAAGVLQSARIKTSSQSRTLRDRIRAGNQQKGNHKKKNTL